MKKRIMITFLTGVSILLLSGCNQKTVNYDPDASELDRSTNDGNGFLKQFAGEEKWNEQFEVTNGDGKTWTIDINADITIPDVEEMSVVEVKEQEFDPDYKKQLAETLFGTNQIYCNDDIYLPKEQLEEKIGRYQTDIANTAAYILDMRQNMDQSDEMVQVEMQALQTQLDELEEKLAACEDALKQEREPYPQADSFEGDSYRGERDGVMYTLDFTKSSDWFDEEESRMVVFRVEDTRSACPEEFKDAENVFNYGAPFGEEGGMDNRCSITAEDAGKLADEYLVKLGLSQMFRTESADCVWAQYSDLDELNTEINDFIVYGYVFTYQLGTDGKAFPLFYQNGEERYEDVTSSWIAVCVTDDGVIGVELYDPVEVISEVDEIELLPLKTIQSIIKDELKKDVGRFGLNSPNSTEIIPFNRMNLGYLPIPDEEHEGYYSYVPVWRLSRKYEPNPMNYCIYINAIDGSAILSE